MFTEFICRFMQIGVLLYIQSLPPFSNSIIIQHGVPLI